MSEFEIGFEQAVAEIISGFITPIIIDAFAQTGLIPQYYLTILSLIVILGNITFIILMSSWGIVYTLGWLFGSFLLLYSGLLGTIDLILYIVLPIIFLVLRVAILIKT